MKLQARIGRFPRRVSRQQLRHVGLRAAWFVGIETTRRFEAHQACRFHVDERARDGKLHALVLPDGPPEHDAFLRIGRHLVDEPIAVADTFRRNQRAFRVEAVEDVPETLPFLANQVFSGDFQVVEEEFVGLVVDHVQDRLHGHAVADRLAQVDDKNRHAFGLAFYIGERRRSGEQDHQVGMLDSRNPYLLAVDHITVATALGSGLDLRRICTGGWLGDAHRLQAQLAACDLRQVAVLLLCRAVPQQRTHVVHLAVACTRVATGTIDLLHDHRGFRQTQSRTAVFLRNQRGEPARFCQCVDEAFRITACFIDLAKIVAGKLLAEVANGFANVLELIGMSGLHRGVLVEFRRASQWRASSGNRHGLSPITRWCRRPPTVCRTP